MYHKIFRIVFLSLLVALGSALLIRVGWEIPAWAQNAPSGSQAPPTSVNMFTPYPVTAISATAGSAATATVTMPAPPSGWYNYICYLAIEGSNDTTATVVTNVVTTSTNFGSFAGKFSTPSTASNDTGVLIFINATPPGCPKSVSPATATTFVSPNSTHEQYNWYATYFQAP